MRRMKLPDNELKQKITPAVSEVLKIIGTAAIIGAAVVIPATPVVVMPILKFIKEKQEEREEIINSKFDKARLGWLLRRLRQQRDVELLQTPEGTTVKLTEKGHVRYLRYKLEEMPEAFSKKKWDGRWRIIVFDVPERERSKRDSFRLFLKRLKFYQLQESVYLAPYSCEGELEYLREYYRLGKKVQVLVTSGLEDDGAYRRYFGLT